MSRYKCRCVCRFPCRKILIWSKFLVLDRKHSFWVNLAENLKTVKSKLKHLKTLSLKPSIPFSVKKRPDVNSIFEYLNKELHNSNITPILIDTRLSTLTIDGKLEIKYPLGKASNWVKSNNALGSSKSKTPTWSPSLPSSLNYETPIIESKKDTVRDIEIIAMKSFIEDYMLMLRQPRKDSTLQKSSCDHNSEIVRVIEDIAYLRNENRTKSCIIQVLID